MIAVENILTQANFLNLSDLTVVLYGRAGEGLEISKRNRGIPPLVLALENMDKSSGFTLILVTSNICPKLILFLVQVG